MTKLIRHQDWPTKLHDFIFDNLDTCFEWGSNDCCLFTCNAILAMTGTDIADDWRGTYDSEEDLSRIMAERGIEGLDPIIEAAAKRFQFPERNIKYAQRGDMVLFNIPSSQVLGICVDHRVAALSFTGMKFVRMDNIYKDPTARCWKV